MRTSKYDEAVVLAVVQAATAEKKESPTKISKRFGVSRTLIYEWVRKYKRVDLAEDLKLVRRLTAENSRLRQEVQRLTEDKRILFELLEKWQPELGDRVREARNIQRNCGVNVSRACELTNTQRSTWYRGKRRS